MPKKLKKEKEVKAEAKQTEMGGIPKTDLEVLKEKFLYSLGGLESKQDEFNLLSGQLRAEMHKQKLYLIHTQKVSGEKIKVLIHSSLPTERLIIKKDKGGTEL